jgi:hypothetical protein
MKIFGSLPNEIINYILEYSNTIVYRNGVYLNRIQNIEETYKLLLKIPRPLRVTKTQICLYLISKPEIKGYVLDFQFDYINKKYFLKISYSSNKYYKYIKTESYIFDIINIWKKINI